MILQIASSVKDIILTSIEQISYLASVSSLVFNIATGNPNDFRRDFTEEDALLLASSAISAERETGIPAAVLIGISWYESRFREYSRGDWKDGVYRSCGPMQIRWDIWRREQRLDNPSLSCDDLMDLDFSLSLAANILVIKQHQCGEDYIAAYNGGCRRARYSRPQWYQTRVLRIASQLEHP